LAEAEALKIRAGSRIERMGVEKVKESKKSSETYTYWIGLQAIG